MPIVLLLGTWIHVLYSPTFQYLLTCMRSLWALHYAGQAVPVLPVCSHIKDAPVPSPPSWPFAGLTSVCPCLSHTGEPNTGHSSPDASHCADSKGSITSLDPLAMLFLIQPHAKMEKDGINRGHREESGKHIGLSERKEKWLQKNKCYIEVANSNSIVSIFNSRG